MWYAYTILFCYGNWWGLDCESELARAVCVNFSLGSQNSNQARPNLMLILVWPPISRVVVIHSPNPCEVFPIPKPFFSPSHISVSSHTIISLPFHTCGGRQASESQLCYSLAGDPLFCSSEQVSLSIKWGK